MSESKPSNIENQRQFWDWHWNNWRERRTINEWKDRRHDVILSFFDSLSVHNARILDIGCGPGHYTRHLAQFGEVTGVDLSQKAVDIAKSKYPQITFIAGDIYGLPLPGEHFNVVVSQETIEHVQDQPAFVDRAAYLLTAKGYFILSCTNKFVMDRLRDGEFPAQPDAHISNPLSVRDLRRLLRSRFHVHIIKTIIPMGHGGILRLINSRKLNKFLELFISMRHLTAFKERAGLGYQMIALAQKKL